jgi:hypothetical protein
LKYPNFRPERENRQLYWKSQRRSTLPLFVARVSTNYPYHALAADDLAITANALHGGKNFHDFFL